MIQLGEPLNRKKTIRCQSCGDRVLYVLHDRKAGDRLRYQDVRFLQASNTTVRNPLYCPKCDSPWINKSTGRVIKSSVKSKSDPFKYFKPMIEDCKASKIKPSELIGREDFFTMIHPVEYISITKLDFLNKKIGIKRAGEEEKIYDLVIQHTPKGFESSFPFKPITGPGLPEMLKDTKAKKRTGYKADSIIIDECKPLTRRQIKEANEALNRLNAKKTTKKRGV